ncbi:MAG TPA: DUF4012 domain-containing protein, partial [Candidatus Dojkabacteria bacterium]|nr:DUF4012 domain-containing protein [Candidatus Dojkabacteria bacterium]
DNFSQLIFGSTYAISGARDIVEATEPLQQYIQSFEPALGTQNSLPATTRQYTDQLAQLKLNKNQLDKGAYNLELASSLINGIDISAFPQVLQSTLVDLKTTNTKISSQIQPIEKFVTFLPDILGLKERMTYLVLLQNPQELRSTGGWISSYAIIGFEGGQIRQFKVDDIYNLDGSLTNKGVKIVPPSSMRNALGVKNMTFSLMNWNPDLQTVKSNAEYMLAQVDPGQKINGVITIDTEFFKQLLNVWGQVNIPGETEAITANNLDDKLIELHKEFTPGQSVKSNFLANLTDTIIKKLLTSKIVDYTNIGTAIFNSLNQKHIMVYLDNKDAFEYFSNNNWAGNIKTDYQSLPFSVQWNWGANKANKYLDQTESVNVDVVSQSRVQYTYSLATQNKSTAKVYPQGDYIDYLRVYVPIEASIDSVTGYDDNKYTVYLENGFKVIGGFSNISVLSSKTVEVKYTLKPTTTSLFQPINTSGNQSTMKLTLFKQAGLGSIPTKLTITYPDSWAAVTYTNLDRFGNQITTQTKLDGDKEFTIIWENK